MAIALSAASKMPCKSWSLNAGETCPGSIDPFTKKVLEVCDGCYAKVGNYRFPNVKKPRDNNRQDWKRTEWVDEMVALLETERYFRWFDSGDVYHPALAFKIYLVIEKTPWCKHWLPTKCHTIPKIRAVLDRIKALPNVVVRYSSPNIDGTFSKEHGSTVVPTYDYPTKANKICDAYERDGKCGTCRSCWDKTVDVIAYVAHSRRMKKLVREKMVV